MSRGRRIPFGFVTVALLFAIAIPFFYREDVLGEPLEPLVLATAEATHGLLRAVGIAVARDGAVLSAPGGFAYEIYYRCTGFLPVLCLTVMVLAYPAPIRRKLAGLAVGIPLLLALNLVRLVHLFQIGVAWPHLFDVAHTYVWEATTVLGVALAWLVYVAWSRAAGRRPAQDGPTIAALV